MIEKGPQLIDHRSTIADGLLRRGNVLAILAAARIAAERGGEKSNRPLHAFGLHLPQRVGQERMPVAVAPVERQLDAGCGELELKSRQERAVLGVDGADATK